MNISEALLLSGVADINFNSKVYSWEAKRVNFLRISVKLHAVFEKAMRVAIEKEGVLFLPQELIMINKDPSNSMKEKKHNS